MIKKSIIGNLNAGRQDQSLQKTHSINVNNPVRYFKHMHNKHIQSNSEYSHDFQDTKWFSFYGLKNKPKKSRGKEPIGWQNKIGLKTCKRSIPTIRKSWRRLIFQTAGRVHRGKAANGIRTWLTSSWETRVRPRWSKRWLGSSLKPRRSKSASSWISPRSSKRVG